MNSDYPGVEYKFWSIPPSLGIEASIAPEFEDEDYRGVSLESTPVRWVAPPGWPTAPEGWSPPLGWRPDPEWGDAPPDWDFWVVDDNAIARLEDEARNDQRRRIRDNLNTLHKAWWKINRIEARIQGERLRVHQFLAPTAVELELGIYARGRDEVWRSFEEYHHTYESLLIKARNELLAALRAGIPVGETYVDLIIEREARAEEYSDQYASFMVYRDDAVERFGDRVQLDRYLREIQRRTDAVLQFLFHRTSSTNSGQSSDWAEAEILVAAYLDSRGFAGSTTTASGQDGGIDVSGGGIVAQVKYRSTPSGRPELQRLVGANTRSHPMAFFSKAGFTSQALSYAGETGIALFEIELPYDVIPVNSLARRIDS